MIPKVRPWLVRYWRAGKIIRETVTHAPTRHLAILNIPMRWKVEAVQMMPDALTCTVLRCDRKGN